MKKQLVFAVLALAGCAAQGRVERRYDGEVVRGRVIQAETYAHYARGALLESQGRYEDALAEYQAVLEIDRVSVSAWTQLGACLCALGRPANDAFDHALRLGPRYASAWYQRALCWERQGADARAASAAARALSLEPHRFEHAALTARVLERLGEYARASELLVAAVLWQPSSVQPRLALADFARRNHDRALLRMSCCLSGDAEPFPLDLPPADAATPHAEAGARGSAARAPSSGAKPMVEHALCAALAGDGAAAVRISSVILDTDADNADAWVALLYGADLLQDPVIFGDALARVGERPTLTYGVARELMTEVLTRRSGESAGSLWGEAWASVRSNGGGATLATLECERRDLR